MTTEPESSNQDFFTESLSRLLDPTHILTASEALYQKGEMAAAYRKQNNCHKWLHYFEVYEEFFHEYKGRSPKLLEIGVFRGGSLGMWKKYFKNKVTVVAVDIDPACAEFTDPENNIVVEIGDQSDPDFLMRISDKYGPFDIILDDGSHVVSHQILSFLTLFPRSLAERGIYMVEDTHTSYWPQFQDFKFNNRDCSFINFATELASRLHEPYFTNHDERFFRKNDPIRLASLKVSEFYKYCNSVHFFDSIVVFRKRERGLPISEVQIP